MRIRGDRQPIIGDKFCLPPDHEVFTSEGWVKIDEVKMSMKLAQLDPADGSVSYVRPTDVQSFMTKLGEQMISIEDESGRRYLKCTPKHKVYCSVGGAPWSLIEADRLVSVSNFSMRTGACPGFGVDDEKTCGCTRLDSMPRARCLLVCRFLRTGRIDGTRAVINERDKELEGHLEMLGARFDTDFRSITIKDPSVVSVLSSLEGKKRLPDFLGGLSDPDLVSIVSSLLSFVLSEDDKTFLSLEKDSRVDRLEARVVNAACFSVHCVTVPTHVFFAKAPGAPTGVWTGNSSRHGQKGTVGIMYRQEEMPFTAKGLVPDIIINPHAIPSRMTVAQLMECIMGKAGLFLGTFGDATPFTDIKIEDLCQILEDHGVERYGNEVMYNSRTGEQLKTTVFIGPTFYQVGGCAPLRRSYAGIYVHSVPHFLH